MTRELIQYITNYQRFPGHQKPATLVETHISWVILSPEFVFKIKKPVQFPFLDFSTLEKRHHYCQEEIRLNRRLAPEMYLRVLPIALDKDGLPSIGTRYTEPLEYAVQMKRIDNNYQMDRLLQQHGVTNKAAIDLARVLAEFHKKMVIPVAEVPYQANDNWTDFKDFFRFEAACTQLFGAESAALLQQWAIAIRQFLGLHEQRFKERAAAGFWVDGHGDLHGRNIFLLPEGPLVFDCIEFNPHFRKLDVLNELAFLCMDLDAADHPELARLFMHEYNRIWQTMTQPEDTLLFQYFKAYRASVRLKVTLIAWQEHPSAALETNACTYWNLLREYLNTLTR